MYNKVHTDIRASMLYFILFSEYSYEISCIITIMIIYWCSYFINFYLLFIYLFIINKLLFILTFQELK